LSRSRRNLTPEEAQLWDRVAAAIKPRARKPAPPEAPPAPAVSPKPRAEGLPARAPSTGPPKSLPPVDRSGEKRVRRGKLDIGAVLDLHGHTQVTAETALTRFLAAAAARGDRTVIVITGVGRGGHGVLKQRLPEWLAAPPLSGLVSGYAPAHRNHGGPGAFYVFLRARRAPR
jgi:DNA-nicking Smr family endonuclease